MALVEFGALKQDRRLLVSLHGQNKDVAFGLRALGVEQQVFPVARPTGGPLQLVRFVQGFFLLRAAGGLLVETAVPERHKNDATAICRPNRILVQRSVHREARGRACGPSQIVEPKVAPRAGLRAYARGGGQLSVRRKGDGELNDARIPYGS